MSTSIRVHRGLPPGEASMPTCGVCRRQIDPDDGYATVLNSSGNLREVRHNTEKCTRFVHGPAAALVPGAVVHTIRYHLAGEHITVAGVVRERTEEFNELGWRAYMIAPENVEDGLRELQRMYEHPVEYFRRLAPTLTLDVGPQKVFISDKEWTHYVLPAS